VTWAFGIALPLWSVTLPLICAIATAWARTVFGRVSQQSIDKDRLAAVDLDINMETPSEATWLSMTQQYCV
jgi:hypothetical protein